MINKIYIGITLLIASFATQSFSFRKFDSSKIYSRVVQDTIKPDSLQAIIDSISVEEGLYNYKLYKRNVHASYYANRFNGKRTASGERFSNKKLTAAHRRLAFGTKVRVTNIRNGKSIIVRINDRGPHVRSREIDLSRKAFMYLNGNRGGGEIRVKMEIAIKKE